MIRQRTKIRMRTTDRNTVRRRVDHACSPRQRCVRCSMIKVIQQRFQAFRSAFGRDPLPNEPLFFAENACSPQTAAPGEVMKQLLRAAKAATVPPQPLLKFLGLEE